MLAERHCVYVGTPRGSLGYLRDKDFACPDGYNAADHWMDLLVRDSMTKTGEDELGSTERSSPAPTAVNHQEEEEEPKTPRSVLIGEWDDEGLAKEIEQESVSSNTKQEDELAVKSGALTGVKKYNTSWLAQYAVLTHRCFKNSRSEIFTPINVIKSALLGVVAGLLNGEYRTDCGRQNLILLLHHDVLGVGFDVLRTRSHLEGEGKRVVSPECIFYGKDNQRGSYNPILAQPQP